MLKIGDFSKLSRVTIKALRYYDDIGLLKPDVINNENGYRYYKPEQLNIVGKIVSLKDMGFSLDEIIYIVKNNPDPLEIIQMLDGRKSQIISSIDAENRRLANVEAFIKNLKEEFVMSEVRLKDLPEVIIASMRRVISNYEDLNELAPAMEIKLQQHGAVSRTPVYCFNIYHDGEYKEKDVDVEICEAVVDFCKDADGICYKKIPAIKTAACIYHKGPYNSIGSSYGEVFKWIEQNGYRVIDNPRESYIDGCWNKENPKDWLTEIEVPIEK